MSNKRYNEDFKRTIVDLYHSGSSVKDLSSEYGVTEVTIYQWIKDFSPSKQSDSDEATSKDMEEMQKEMARLKEENEILKKAMTIFAKK